jgi:hypothetical protein
VDFALDVLDRAFEKTERTGKTGREGARA